MHGGGRLAVLLRIAPISLHKAFIQPVELQFLHLAEKTCVALPQSLATEVINELKHTKQPRD